MGLGDLVTKEERKAKVKYGNQSELTDHEGIEVSSEPGEGVEYGGIEKPCPQCGCLSAGDHPRTFNCPNQDCAVSKFTMGWNEHKGRRHFLGTVEIDGWRHDE